MDRVAVVVLFALFLAGGISALVALLVIHRDIANITINGQGGGQEFGSDAFFTEWINNGTLLRLSSISFLWTRILILSSPPGQHLLANLEIASVSINNEIQINTTDGHTLTFMGSGQDITVEPPLSVGRRRLLSLGSERLAVMYHVPLLNLSDYLIPQQFSDGSRFHSQQNCAGACSGGISNCHLVTKGDRIFPRFNPQTFSVCRYPPDLGACQEACSRKCNPSNETCEPSPVLHADCTEFVNGDMACQCSAGWTASDEECTDINECLVDTHNCVTGCINSLGSFQCEPCPPGYQGDGTICLDIDECLLTDPECDSGWDCFNEPGSFDCVPCRAPALNDTDTLDPRCPRYLAFVVPLSYNSARLGGLDMADGLCRDSAGGAGLQGTFRAWLSSSRFPIASDRLFPPRQQLDWPYILPDGHLLARSFQDFLWSDSPNATHLLGNRFNVMANGTAVYAENLLDVNTTEFHVAFIGMDPAGLIPDDQSYGCADWTSDSFDMLSIGGLISNWTETSGSYPYAWNRRVVLRCDGSEATIGFSDWMEEPAVQIHTYVYCVAISTECDGSGFIHNNENGTCVDINECTTEGETCALAGLECLNTEGSFTCQCENNATTMMWNFTTNECVHTELCPERLDLSCPFFSPCSESGICGPCMSGFNGSDCRDINECMDAGLCSVSDGFECTNLVGNFSCIPCFFQALQEDNLTELPSNCPFSRAFLLPLSFDDLTGNNTLVTSKCADEAEAAGIKRMGMTFRPFYSDAVETLDQTLAFAAQTAFLTPNGNMLARGPQDLLWPNSTFITQDKWSVLANGTSVIGRSYLVITSLNAANDSTSDIPAPPELAALFVNASECLTWNSLPNLDTWIGLNGVGVGVIHIGGGGGGGDPRDWLGPFQVPCAVHDSHVEYALYCVEVTTFTRPHLGPDWVVFFNLET